MKAIVQKPFRGCLPGQVYPKQFKLGDELSGEFAQKMVDAGFARKVVEGAPKNAALEAAPENRFRLAGMEGRNGDSDSIGSKPKRRRGRPRKDA